MTKREKQLKKRKLVSKIYDDVMTGLVAIALMAIIASSYIMAVITY